EAFLSTYEYEEHELLGQSITMVRVDGDRQPAPDIAAIDGGAGWRGELLNRSKGGRVFPIALSTSLVRDDGGRARAVVSVARDITAEKQSQDSLRASEERFARAFESSPDCIGLMDFGPGGILEVNERFEEMFGYARSEIIGRRLIDLGILVNPSQRDV